MSFTARFSRTLSVLMMSLLVGACSSQPGGNWTGVNTPQDRGDLPPDYEERAMTALESNLKDPYSAKAEVGIPVSGACQIGLHGNFYGWRVPVTYNAKNSYGAYVGEKTVYYWFNGPDIKRVSSNIATC